MRKGEKKTEKTTTDCSRDYDDSSYNKLHVTTQLRRVYIINPREYNVISVQDVILKIRLFSSRSFRFPAELE